MSVLRHAYHCDPLAWTADQFFGHLREVGNVLAFGRTGTNPKAPPDPKRMTPEEWAEWAATKDLTPAEREERRRLKDQQRAVDALVGAFGVVAGRRKADPTSQLEAAKAAAQAAGYTRVGA